MVSLLLFSFSVVASDVKAKTTGGADDKKTGKEASKSGKVKKAKREPKSATTDDIPLGYVENKTTIEVFDDASPDATPRLDEDDINKKVIAREKARLAEQQVAEKRYRKLQFEDERGRVMKGADTFVANANVTAADIEAERLRLAKIEESARSKAKREQAELKGHKQYLQQDRSALRIQAAFRGRLGRQKFQLTHSLKSLQDNDEYGEWVHVVDPDSGDA